MKANQAAFESSLRQTIKPTGTSVGENPFVGVNKNICRGFS